MRNLFILLMVTPIIMFGQGWERTYGGVYDDWGFSGQQTTDGGYIITGSTDLYGNNSYHVYLIKTDGYGYTLWTKTFGGFVGKSVQQTTDGGYIITGATESPDVFLIKTDSNGDTLWTRTYGGEDEYAGNSVQQTTDGGYIITGNIIYGNESTDIYLIKTDSDGGTLWTKTLGGELDDGGSSVQQTNDGGYIITGYTGSNYIFDVYLIKTDSFGDTLWTKTFGGEGNDYGSSVKQTTDDGYIISGSTTSFGYGGKDVYLIKTDSYGDTLWTKTIGGADNDIGSSVQQTTDGGYIITGSTYSFGNGSENLYLIKTDSYGDTLWNKYFGEYGNGGGKSVQQTTDGGYFITGTIFYSRVQYHSDVYLIKTNGDGIVTFTSEIPYVNPNRKLTKIVDLLGREITEPLEKTHYLEIYDDGSSIKKMRLK